MKWTKKVLSVVLTAAMLAGLLPATALAVLDKVAFSTDSNAVEFATSQQTGFEDVSLTPEGKPSYIPVVYRTDTLDYAFDGWYTGKDGAGDKVTADTVFNGYAILYDHWVASNIPAEKRVQAVNIDIAAPVNSTTAEVWYNSCSLTIAAEGVQNLDSYALYQGLNASGALLADDAVIDTNTDYSAKVTLRLEDGYYFDYGISLTASNGVRAGTAYQSNGVNTEYWNNLATQIMVTINFPGGAGGYTFTTQPVSGAVSAGELYSFSWAVDGEPQSATLEVKNGENWLTADTLDIENKTASISSQPGTKTYRILVNYQNGSVYSNEFTVTWFDANANSFNLNPTGGTVKNGTSYSYSWACLQTPATAVLERKDGENWVEIDGNAGNRQIPYLDAYENTTQTFRIKATMALGDPFYSDTFAVTYIVGPHFTTQPQSGVVAVGQAYDVSYVLDDAGGSLGDMMLQSYDGMSWSACGEAYMSSAHVPAQNSEANGTFRVGIQVSGEWVYSEPFTVAWKQAAQNVPNAANISIGGTKFSSAPVTYYKNGDTTTFTGTELDYNAKYDPFTGTLQLKNFNGGIIACNSPSSYELKLELVGTNTITVAGDGSNTPVAAMEINGSLTITGEGSLTVAASSPGSRSYMYGISVNNILTVSENTTVTVSAQNGLYTYALCSMGGVLIADQAAVSLSTTLTEEGSTGYGIYCSAGQVLVGASASLTVQLGGTAGATNYGVLTDCVDENMTNNGDVTLRGTVEITAAGVPYSYGIYAGNAYRDCADAVLLLEDAEVSVTGCDCALYTDTQQRTPDAADILIQDSTLTVLSDVKDSSAGVHSRRNGILIEDSTVSITAARNALCTDDSNSGYGMDIRGNSQVTLTGTANGYLMRGKSYGATSDIDLAPGGSVTIKDAMNSAASVMYRAFIRMGAGTVTNGQPGSANTAETGRDYYCNGAPLTFTGVCTAQFDANDGSGTMDPMTADGGSVTLPECTFTPPDGKLFKAWKVNGMEHNPGEVISLGDNVTVIALWQQGYTISFSANGGSGTMDSVLVPAGAYALPECTFTAPVGSTFTGWSAAPSGELLAGSYPVSSDATLYARWSASAQITQLSAVLEGFSAGATVGSVTVSPAESGYTTQILQWQHCNNIFKYESYDEYPKLSDDYQFVNGQTYTVGVLFTPVTPGTFANQLTAKINGETGGIGGSGAGESKFYYVALTATQQAVDYYTVSVTALYSCGAAYNYHTEQKVEQGQPMTDIVITANDGYYFPEDLEVQGAGNGVTVNRNSYTQVTVSGTPEASVYIGFAAKAKTKEETPNSVYFTATGSDCGDLANLAVGVSYSVTGAATAEFTATGDTYALTGVQPGNLNIVRKAANVHTKLDSEAYPVYVGKTSSVPNCYFVNCSDPNNNNGTIWSVAANMEWKAEGGVWTAGTGGNVTGLIPGTYYVRYSASGSNLASEPQVINIASYNTPELTGTVTITGEAKFGETLTANVADSNNTGELLYQWVRNNSNISGAVSDAYTLTAEDISSSIKVKVTSTTETGTLTSDATELVGRADGPAAPVGLTGVSPSVIGGTDGKITGVTTDMEYSATTDFAEADICPDGTLAGLAAGTYYVRYRQTLTHEAGAYAAVVVGSGNISFGWTGDVCTVSLQTADAENFVLAAGYQNGQLVGCAFLDTIQPSASFTCDQVRVFRVGKTSYAPACDPIPSAKP